MWGCQLRTNRFSILQKRRRRLARKIKLIITAVSLNGCYDVKDHIEVSYRPCQTAKGAAWGKSDGFSSNKK